jgi:pyruvate formate lyase activating enzyme
MKEALYYARLQNGIVQCDLCPKNCKIKPGESGNCLVRVNKEGKLYTEVYDQVSAIHIDPIEKKPLFHFYPGKQILSIGGVGCNFHCSFCQNYSISQCRPSDYLWLKDMPVQEIVKQAAVIRNNIGVAYTYNEPFTFYEFMADISSEVKEHDLKNVVISNGFINEAPLKAILPFIDAFNIDLKAFNDKFYMKYSKGKLLPVLKALKIIGSSNAHLEITFLVIPGLNDDPHEFEAMLSWISGNLGNHVPLHLSRYFPQYKLTKEATPEETMIRFYRMAREKLEYVFLGNVYTIDKANTYCPACGYEVISRSRYIVKTAGLTASCTCLNCGQKLQGIIC